jgi:hypothetical protein
MTAETGRPDTKERPVIDGCRLLCFTRSSEPDSIGRGMKPRGNHREADPTIKGMCNDTRVTVSVPV